MKIPPILVLLAMFAGILPNSVIAQEAVPAPVLVANTPPLHGHGYVQGQVVDAISGEPMIGVHLQLKDTQFGAVSDLEGRFSFENVPVGQYEMTAQMMGFAPVNKTCWVPVSGAEVTVDIQLQESALLLEEIGAPNRGSGLRIPPSWLLAWTFSF